MSPLSVVQSAMTIPSQQQTSDERMAAAQERYRWLLAECSRLNGQQRMDLLAVLVALVPADVETSLGILRAPLDGPARRARIHGEPT